MHYIQTETFIHALPCSWQATEIYIKYSQLLLVVPFNDAENRDVGVIHWNIICFVKIDIAEFVCNKENHATDVLKQDVQIDFLHIKVMANLSVLFCAKPPIPRFKCSLFPSLFIVVGITPT